MAEKEKKKGKKGFMLGVIIGLPLIGGGAFVGLAMTGVLKVPGLTPKSKLAAGLYGEAASLYGEAASLYSEPEELEIEAEVEEKPAPPPATPVVAEPPPTDPEAGAKKLAKVWNAMETPQLLAISKEFKDADLALVMSKMETEASAALLSALDAKRAAAVSKELQRLGSLVPVEE